MMSGPQLVAQGQSAAGTRCREPGSITRAAGGPYKAGCVTSCPSLLWQTDLQTHIWKTEMVRSRDPEIREKAGP